MSPTEPVGVLCLRDGKNGVIEYSEIDKDLAAKRDASGELVFNAAHLCMNTYRIDFLENVARNYAKALPYVFTPPPKTTNFVCFFPTSLWCV